MSNKIVIVHDVNALLHSCNNCGVRLRELQKEINNNIWYKFYARLDQNTCYIPCEPVDPRELMARRMEQFIEDGFFNKKMSLGAAIQNLREQVNATSKSGNNIR